jgi:hypothetical protein
MRILNQLAFVSLLVLMASCSTLGVFGPKEMRYSNTQLQKHLSKRFPRDWSGLGFVNIRLSAPAIDIPKHGDHVLLTMDVAGGLGNERPQVMGRIQLESSLRFDKTQQAVFLDQPRLLSSNLNGIGKTNADANRVGTLLLNELAARMPVYRAEDAYTDGFGREWKLDDARIDNGKLQIRMIRSDDTSR